MASFSFNSLSQTIRSCKRVGRGIASGTGKTSGAGHKGQKARSGASVKIRRADFARIFPKVGFSPRKSTVLSIGIQCLLSKLKDEKDNIIIDNGYIAKFNKLRSRLTVKIIGKPDNDALSTMDYSKFTFVGLSMSNGVKTFLTNAGAKISQ